MSTHVAEVFRNHVTMDDISINSQSAQISSSRRVSMEEYYKQNNESSDQIQEPEVEEEPEEESEHEPEMEMEDKSTNSLSMADPLLDSPPSYDASVRSQNMRNRLNIQPREDEGREILPGYSAGISLENVFMRKMEMQGAIHRASDRNWLGVFGLELGDRKSTPDLPAGTKRGNLLGSYNLQHAEVGIAADYVKKHYVIRVRAEADQFLLSCVKIETFVTWLQSLFTAINLSMPLDERQIPRDQSIPRSRRRRRREPREVQVNDELIRAQEELIRTHYPNFASSNTPEGRAITTSTRPSTARPSTQSSAPHTSRTPVNASTKPKPRWMPFEIWVL
ncbi:ph domain-containing protein [Botrytis cinerea]